MVKCSDQCFLLELFKSLKTMAALIMKSIIQFPYPSNLSPERILTVSYLPVLSVLSVIDS